MFVDGLWYAAIANNLAQGIGSAWSPQFTETVFPQFHEHPPLQFWLQSAFFKILGSGLFTERLYCFLMVLISVFSLYFLWKFIYKQENGVQYLAFLPILFWLLNEDVILSYPNNLLECTMGVFTFSAVFVLLLLIENEVESRFESYNWSLVVIAGVLTYLAFLAKGLVGLFPLAFFAVHWLAFRRLSLQKSILYTILLVGICGFCLIITLQFTEAYHGLVAYFNNQVIAALQGERTENIRPSHFYILKRLLEKNMVMILLSIGFAIGFQYFKTPFLNQKDRQWVIFLLLTGITASFPLMISIKQASYYLLPSLPFYCTAFAVLIGRGLFMLVSKIQIQQFGYKFFTIVSLLFLGYAVYYTFSQLEKIDKRDQMLLTEVRMIGSSIPNGTTISSKTQQFEAALHGYFQRYYYISLDEKDQSLHSYLLISKELDTLPLENYRRMKLPLHKYHFYKKIKTN
jgi:4-amino-4-deoxy-L-arabinose transferase-like glycosyltransferase